MAANAILEADIFKSTYFYSPSMIMLLQHIHCCLIVFMARNISIFMYSNKWGSQAQLNVFINFDQILIRFGYGAACFNSGSDKNKIVSNILYLKAFKLLHIPQNYCTKVSLKILLLLFSITLFYDFHENTFSSNSASQLQCRNGSKLSKFNRCFSLSLKS